MMYYYNNNKEGEEGGYAKCSLFLPQKLLEII